MSPGAASKGVDFTISGNIYDTLIREMPDNRSEFREGLATDWTLSEDGTELLFTIRDGVKFHDGSDLTVDDVVFSLQWDLEQARQSLDDEERLELYSQIGELNKENNWYIYTHTGYNGAAYNAHIANGFYECNNYAIYNNIAEWTWE